MGPVDTKLSPLTSALQDNITCPICRVNLADGNTLSPPHH